MDANIYRRKLRTVTHISVTFASGASFVLNLSKVGHRRVFDSKINKPESRTLRMILEDPKTKVCFADKYTVESLHHLGIKVSGAVQFEDAKEYMLTSLRCHNWMPSPAFFSTQDQLRDKLSLLVGDVVYLPTHYFYLLKKFNRLVLPDVLNGTHPGFNTWLLQRSEGAELLSQGIRNMAITIK